MDNIDVSRRTLVAGGVLATAALAAGTWWRGSAVPATANGVTVVTGGTTPGAPARPAALAQAVGQAVQLNGGGEIAAATLVAITPLPMRGNRPAGVRAAPYRMTFHTPRAGAPEGNKTYALGAPIDGMDRLYLARGTDQGENAVLFAVVA